MGGSRNRGGGGWMEMEFNDCAFEGSPSPTQDRRHRARRDVRLQAHLFPDLRDDEESDRVEVMAVNLTRHGVGLDLPHDVPVGTVYNIEIGIGDRKVQSQVRITSCDPIADGLYRAGGEYC